MIHYNDFLAVVVDKRLALAKKNLELAFHHFESKNSGYITEESLIECFRREGKQLSKQEVSDIMSQVEHKDDKRISF